MGLFLFLFSLFFQFHRNEGKLPASRLRVVAKTPLRLETNLDTQILRVQRAIIHSKFSYTNTHYDIALLKLRQPIELDNKWAAAITLPEKRINDTTLCIVLGWGKLYLVSLTITKISVFI